MNAKPGLLYPMNEPCGNRRFAVLSENLTAVSETRTCLRMDRREPPGARERTNLIFRMTVPFESSIGLSQEPAGSRETVISCLVRIGTQLGIDLKTDAVRCGTAGEGDRVTLSDLIKLADEFGFNAEWSQLDWHELKSTDLTRPILIFRKNSDAAIVTGDGRPGA